MNKLDKKKGIQLDIGCGENPQPGFVGIDILPLPNVDIVWDLEKTPWPLEDESVVRAIASHVLEHIEPHGGIFINVMNEIWRVLKPGAQFAFVVPYGESAAFIQDPTHCNPMNETTMHYFDPMSSTNLYWFYRPKPWKIERQFFDTNGFLEVLLTKRPMDPSYEPGYKEHPSL
jgi:SAM-dependent methyltransferase